MRSRRRQRINDLVFFVLTLPHTVGCGSTMATAPASTARFSALDFMSRDEYARTCPRSEIPCDQACNMLMQRAANDAAMTARICGATEAAYVAGCYVKLDSINVEFDCGPFHEPEAPLIESPGCPMPG